MEIDVLKGMTLAELEHHGVKGMKWGVIKGGGVRSITGSGIKKIKGTTKAHLDSAKRERSWAKMDTSKMSAKKLKNTANRVRLENELKSHARGSGKKSARKDYLNRANLSTKDLQKKVQRLNLEREFKKSAGTATKAQKVLVNSLIKNAMADPTMTGVVTGVVADQAKSYIKDRSKY